MVGNGSVCELDLEAAPDREGEDPCMFTRGSSRGGAGGRGWREGPKGWYTLSI